VIDDSKARAVLEKQKKLDDVRKRNQEEYQKAREAMQVASKDPNVQVLLRHIAKISGFFKVDVVVNPATFEINPMASLYNSGRRSLYIDLRRMMDEETKRTVESKED
jgi:hypothetical protein